MLSQALNPVLKKSGNLILDTNIRQVRRGAQIRPVSGLPFQILELLMAAEGRVVTRQALKAKLWPYATRIDVDRRLNTAIRALRKAIEEDTSGKVITVRGYGYRWVSHEPDRSPRRRYLMAIGSAVLVATVGLLANPHEEVPPRATAASAAASAADHRLSANWDWRGAEALYRGALAAQPDLVEAHRGLAWLYVNEGRRADALPHIARLLEAPDRTPARRAELGWLLMRAGKPDAALAICSKPDERSLNLLSCRHTALADLGLIAEARETAAELMRVAGADSAAIRGVSDATALAGYAKFLLWRTEHFVKPQGDWFQRAQLQAEAGMYAQALDSLEMAAGRHDPLLVKIQSTAAFTKLRSSTRFRRIEERVMGYRPSAAA